MAFETGTALHPQDLLDKIVTRATADGWVGPGGSGPIRTTGYRDGGGPGIENQVTMSDASATQVPHFHFLADDTTPPSVTAHINCKPSVSDGGASTPFYQHPGAPTTNGPPQCVSIGHRGSATDQGFGGPYTAYWFFTGSTSDGRYFHVVVEGDAGVYFHLHWGTLEKSGTYNGGAYMTGVTVDDSNAVNWSFNHNPGGQNATQYLRVDNILTGGSLTSDGGTSYWTENFGHAFYSSGLSWMWMAGGLIPWNQRTPFAPNICTCWEDLSPVPGDDFAILGHTPDMRIISMDGREPGEIVTIGSDDWYLFPVHTKTAVTLNPYISVYTAGSPPNTTSNLAGYAYRKNP